MLCFNFCDWLDGTLYGDVFYAGRIHVCFRVDGDTQWRVDDGERHIYDTDLERALDRITIARQLDNGETIQTHPES